ncbi:uncharacterized protein LOC117959437 [Etheostoma cragini]|uniref:uncharacterized protein LOC117959437 n=1 Tax=Etheostoma cragini TaxID=417921 RepID=UPI00155F513A|nr:uncharacterized protein LOC117959437 [Etheostoma cragini]
MGQQIKEMDTESLQTSGRRRGSCLDVFLVGSIILLFVTVVAVAAGGVMVVMELRSELQSKCARPPVEFETSKLSGITPDPAYKMQNFAYLEAGSSKLENSTMHWAAVNYGTGRSVGSNFLFNEKQHWLKAEKDGTYFIYIELNLSCTYDCNAGILRVKVGDKLTCEVELPAVADSTPVSKKCWTVSQLNGQKLLTEMIVPTGLQNWKLELSGSKFGMFLVD